jgi:hypothetical protein
MKYNILINQKAIVDMNPEMTLTECAVLEVIMNLCNAQSSRIKRINVNGKIYTWVDLKTVFVEAPLLLNHFTTTSNLTRLINRLEKYGYIRRYHKFTRRNDGKLNNKLYVCLTDKTDLLKNDKSPKTAEGD